MSILVTQLIARVIADTTAFNAGMAQVNAETKATEAATAGSAARAGGAARRMSTASKVAVGGIAIGLFKAAGSFMNYDKQMNITQRVTLATNEQMKQMRAEAVKLGADIRLPGVSAADVAVGMQELGRAGFKANAVMQSIEGTMLLGTAGQIEYGDAAKITAQAINTFSLAHSKAGHVADLFSAAANASQAEVGDIADAFRYSATQARQAGVGIDDLTLLIAQLSNRGIEASVAGTSLRAMFTRLTPQTDKQAAAFDKLGLLTKEGKSAFFDQQGQFVGLAKASALYQNAIKDLSQEERIRLGHQAFGVAAQRGFNNTLAQGPRALEKLRQGFHTEGAAARVAAANAKGLNGAVLAFTNLVETLGINLGEAMAPTLIQVFNALNMILGPLSKNKFAMQLLVALLGLLIVHLIAVRVQMIYTSIANGVLARSFIVLGRAIMMNPLGLLAVAILAIILILRHFGVSLDDVKKAFIAAMDFIVKGATMVIKWFKNNWQAIVMWVLFPLPMMVREIIKHWDKVKAAVTATVSAIWKWITEKFWAIVHFIENLAPIAYAAAHTLGDSIARGVLDGMGSLAKKINPFSHIPGVNAIGGFLGENTARAWHAGDHPAKPLLRQHHTTNPNTPEGRRSLQSATSPAVHIENVNIKDQTDLELMTGMLGRKLATR